MSILTKADELINGDRNVSYGHPRDNFKAIADQWQAYLLSKPQPVVIEAIDVANMMILMKVARVVSGVYHEDSYTDIAGYAGTAERLQEPVRRVWDRLEDIPVGTSFNSADEDDTVVAWYMDSNSEPFAEGDFGVGPWREHIEQDEETL